MTTILRDPLENTNSFSLVGAATIVAGRTANGMQLGVNGTANYLFPAANESDYVTLGFALRPADLANGRRIVGLYSDGNTTFHDSLALNTNGSITLRREVNTPLATSATGVIAAATYSYVEWQIRLHDTLGSSIVRVNGAEVINLSGIDTKNGGTKTVFDAMRLGDSGSPVLIYDDLYVATGSGETFKGAITITEARDARHLLRVAHQGAAADTAIARDARHVVRIAQQYPTTQAWLTRLATRTLVAKPGVIEVDRHQVRVLVQTGAPVVLSARSSTRVALGFGPAGSVVDARQAMRVALAFGPTGSIVDARHTLRVLRSFDTDEAVPTGATVKAWTGSAFASAPIRAWSGSAFIDAVAVRTWNGSAFV